ncbi:MAG: DUF4276 family protein [Treponema sp.]|nr:DUF4276 family protein [Treponema sp.]
MSIRVYIVTEGQTETNFVKTVLVPHFQIFDITLVPFTVVTKNDKKTGRQYKGGISHYQKAKRDILKCMTYTKNPSVYVSTFFDFYRLPADFPGYIDAQRINDPYQKVEFLEKSLQDDIRKNGPSFLPYLSLHEFEALLFSNIDVIEEHFFDRDVTSLTDTVSQYQNPELINNGEQTSPSKRILQCVPEYIKPTDGVKIAQKIGLDALRAKCGHFDNWIGKLEKLESSRLVE